MTQFSYSVGNATSGGERIIPLTADEARAYLENEGERGVEAIERYTEAFGVIDA